LAGIKVLTGIVAIDARYALEHQNIVLDCLEHRDIAIKTAVSIFLVGAERGGGAWAPFRGSMGAL